MSKANRKWHSISVPEKVFKRIAAILGFVVDESLAEYARHAIKKRLEFDEARAEEQKMEEQEIKERLKD